MQYKYPTLHDIEWLKKEIETKSLRRIAKELGCHNSAVMWAVKKYHITIPYRETHYYVNGSSWNKGLKGIFVGPRASNWRGGRRKLPQGYIYIYKPVHPYATKEGYVMEHRLVMEKHLGRVLDPKECVHHMNEVKDDNRLVNLKLCKSNGENTKVHFGIAKELAEIREKLKQYEDRYGKI